MRHMVMVTALVGTLALASGCGEQTANHSAEEPFLVVEHVAIQEPTLLRLRLLSDTTLLCTLALPDRRQVISLVHIPSEIEILADTQEDQDFKHAFRIEGPGVQHWKYPALQQERFMLPPRMRAGSNPELIILRPSPLSEPYWYGRRSAGKFVWDSIWLPFPVAVPDIPVSTSRMGCRNTAHEDQLFEHLALNVSIRRIYPERDMLLASCYNQLSGEAYYALYCSHSFEITDHIQIPDVDAEPMCSSPPVIYHSSWTSLCASPIIPLENPVIPVFETEGTGSERQYCIRFLGIEPFIDHGCIQLQFQTEKQNPLDSHHVAVNDPSSPNSLFLVTYRWPKGATEEEDAIEYIKQRVTLTEDGPRIVDTTIMEGLPERFMHVRSVNDTFVWMYDDDEEHIVAYEILTGAIHTLDVPAEVKDSLSPHWAEDRQWIRIATAQTGPYVAIYRDFGDRVAVINLHDEEDITILTTSEMIAG